MSDESFIEKLKKLGNTTKEDDGYVKIVTSCFNGLIVSPNDDPRRSSRAMINTKIATSFNDAFMSSLQRAQDATASKRSTRDMPKLDLLTFKTNLLRYSQRALNVKY